MLFSQGLVNDEQIKSQSNSARINLIENQETTVRLLIKKKIRVFNKHNLSLALNRFYSSLGLSLSFSLLSSYLCIICYLKSVCVCVCVH